MTFLPIIILKNNVKQSNLSFYVLTKQLHGLVNNIKLSNMPSDAIPFLNWELKSPVSPEFPLDPRKPS